MKKSELERLKGKLLDARPRLTDEIHRSIEAVIEEINPVGEDYKEPSEGLDKEVALERAQEGILNAINDALDRVEAGTFGKCVGCGKAIARDRLEAMPYVAYCTDCERALEAD
ncbi:MAG: TraR/DksA C4-type zinc finger protein [Planctomycetaceae bacterium]